MFIEQTQCTAIYIYINANKGTFCWAKNIKNLQKMKRQKCSCDHLLWRKNVCKFWEGVSRECVRETGTDTMGPGIPVVNLFCAGFQNYISECTFIGFITGLPEINHQVFYLCLTLEATKVAIECCFLFKEASHKCVQGPYHCGGDEWWVIISLVIAVLLISDI